MNKEGWVKVMVQPARNEKKQKIAAKEVRLRSKKKK